MQPYLINYLNRQHGRNLERIIPGLSKVNEKHRFDEHRFDILALDTDEKIFYGIKDCYQNGASQLAKIREDAEWFKRYGTPLMLLPSDQKEKQAFFPEIKTMFYFFQDREYHFVDHVDEKSEKDKYTELALKMLTHPQTINYVLTRMSRKSEVFRALKTLYSVSRRLR